MLYEDFVANHFGLETNLIELYRNKDFDRLSSELEKRLGCMSENVYWYMKALSQFHNRHFKNGFECALKALDGGDNISEELYKRNILDDLPFLPLYLRHGCFLYTHQSSFFGNYFLLNFECASLDNAEVEVSISSDMVSEGRVKRHQSKRWPSLAGYAFIIDGLIDFDPPAADFASRLKKHMMNDLCECYRSLRVRICANGRERLTISPETLGLFNEESRGFLFRDFVAMIAAMSDRPRVLEIGGRGDNSVRRRQICEKRGIEYLSVDIKDGTNVDIVGDVHSISETVAPSSVDGVLSQSVFEHLSHPWVAAVELNRILKNNGLCYVHVPYQFNMHMVPWDFFRFSPYSFAALFDDNTGYQILKTSIIGTSRIVFNCPQRARHVCSSFARSPNTTEVLARKIHEPAFDRACYTLAEGEYPG